MHEPPPSPSLPSPPIVIAPLFSTFETLPEVRPLYSPAYMGSAPLPPPRPAYGRPLPPLQPSAVPVSC